MNNSSAYNNILLKTVQSQPAQVPVPKRNYQDEQAPVSFQQSFKDVHESVRAQDEKVAKPVAKKAAAVDNRKPANEVEKKSAAPAKQTDESRSRDKDVAERDTASDANENSAAQNSASNDSPAKNSDDKSTDKKVAADDDSVADVVTADASLINPLVATQPLTPPVDDVVTAPTVTTGAANLEAPVGSTADVLPVSPADTADVVAINASSKDLGLKDASLTSATNDQVQATKTTSETDSKLPDGDIDASVIAQQLTADLSVPQAAAAVVTPDVVAEQAPITAAVLGVAPKTALASTTPQVQEAADEDALSAITSPLMGEVSTKAATTKTVDVAAAPTTVSPEPTLDVKSIFEKTLQNLTRPETATRDENVSVASSANTTSTPSSTTNTVDSMVRFNDTQTPAARSFVVQTAVPVAVGQPQWSQAVGEKVLWLAAQNVSAAEIHLNPENLGPMQVKVSVNQEQTTINFTSHHAVVREVLDQNLGRLRDMFSEQGLNLVNVDVSDKSFNRQQGEAKEQQGQAANNESSPEEETQVAVSLIKQQRLVDHYA